MKIACAFDHAGFPLKTMVIEAVEAAGHEVEDLVALPGDGLEDHRLQREPRMVERARDLHAVSPDPEIAPCRFWPVSSAYSWAAISAAPSTPARGP